MLNKNLENYVLDNLSMEIDSSIDLTLDNPLTGSKRHYHKKLQSILEKIFFVSWNYALAFSYSDWRAYLLKELSFYGKCFKPMLRPQYKCGKYRIDFVIVRRHIKIAIELDGFAFHEKTKEQFQYERERQNYIISKGYAILRFTWKDITENFQKSFSGILEIIENSLNSLRETGIK